MLKSFWQSNIIYITFKTYTQSTEDQIIIVWVSKINKHDTLGKSNTAE